MFWNPARCALLTLPQFRVLSGVTQDSHGSICFPEVNVHKDPDGRRRRGWQMSNLKGSLGNVRKKQKTNCFSQVLARAFYMVLFNTLLGFVIFRQRWRSLITEQEKGVWFFFVTFFVIDPIVCLIGSILIRAWCVVPRWEERSVAHSRPLSR